MKTDKKSFYALPKQPNPDPAELSDSELIRLILHSRKPDAFTVSEDFDASYSITKDLAKCRCVTEVQSKFGLARKQATSLLAAVELAKRINVPSYDTSIHITKPSDAMEYLMNRLRYENHEKFLVMLLNTKNRIIRVAQVSEGSLTSAVVHPREVFSFAIIHHAACILVSHNHPSGDPYPSNEDRELTGKLEEAGTVLGIPLLDHIVIGDGKYYSFKEHGDL